MLCVSFYCSLKCVIKVIPPHSSESPSVREKAGLDAFEQGLDKSGQGLEEFGRCLEVSGEVWRSLKKFLNRFRVRVRLLLNYRNMKWPNQWILAT